MDRESNLAKLVVGLVVVLVVVGLISGIVLLFNMSNPHTDGGSAGYVVQKPIFSQARYIGVQKGPTSTGWAWRYEVKNVSVTPFKDEEDFPLEKGPLSKDQLKVGFHLSVTWRIESDETSIKTYVERFATPKEGDKPGDLENRSYDDFLQQQARSLAFSELSARVSEEINTNSEEIQQHAAEKLRAYVKQNGAPFTIISVQVTNLTFPPEVANAVAKKKAAQQELEQQSTQLSIIQRKAEQRVEEAKGLAESQKIISASLDSNYLVYLAIKAQEAQIDSNNHTVVYIPTGSMGVPVLTMDATKPNLPSKSAEAPKPAQPAPAK